MPFDALIFKWERVLICVERSVQKKNCITSTLKYFYITRERGENFVQYTFMIGTTIALSLFNMSYIVDRLSNTISFRTAERMSS